MNGAELNAQAVSFATIATGVGTLISYIPATAGTIASIFGALLAYQSWKNKRMEAAILKKKNEEDG